MAIFIRSAPKPREPVVVRQWESEEVRQDASGRAVVRVEYESPHARCWVAVVWTEESRGETR